MKLNYRDKILLTVVIVILVWVAGIMLFIKPAISDVSDASAKLDTQKATLSDLQAQIDADKDLDTRIDTAYSEVTQLSNNFYSYQQTQEATQVVDDLLKTDNIVNEDMTISSYSTMVLKAYAFDVQSATTEMDTKVDDYVNGTTENTDEAADGTTSAAVNANAGNGQSIGAYTISFSFTGTLDDVKNFCTKLKSNPEKTLVIDECSFKFKEDSTTEVEGSMSLSMIVLKKLPTPEG